MTGGAVAVGFGVVPANALDIAKTKILSAAQSDVVPVTPIDDVVLTEATAAVQCAQSNVDPITPINTASVEAAWRGWMVESGVTESSLAIGHAGAILHSAAQKRLSENAYPMASLSKAITAMCLNQILLHSAYSRDSTMSDLAPEFAKMNFTPASQMASLTLTQVATHTSGLPTKLHYGKMSTRNVTLSSQPTMARAALKEAENLGPRGSYNYSNANYAILGFLIEAMTGEPYADHCKRTILRPKPGSQGAWRILRAMAVGLYQSKITLDLQWSGLHLTNFG